MKHQIAYSPDGKTATLTIPLVFRVFGGRKEIRLPDSSEPEARSQKHLDKTLIKALGRAFRWEKGLDDGTYGSIQDVGRREKINPAYVGRLLKLTLLAPDLVAGILDGDASITLKLSDLTVSIPTEWADQRRCFRRSS